MNPMQTMAMLLSCLAIVALKTSLIMAQGLSLFMALLLVYLVALVFMLSLQHRARQSWDSATGSQPDADPPAPARREGARLTLV